EGDAYQSEHRLIPENGQVMWVVCQAEKITNASGKVTGYVRTVTDVTRQKQIEQALRVLSTDLARVSGTTFYEDLTKYLADFLKCDVVALCRNDPKKPDRVVTVTLLEDGQIQPNINYSVAETPCVDVLHAG